MMKQLLYTLTMVVLVWACNKEQSFETGLGLNAFAEGSLKDSTNGSCAGISIFGTYKVDSTLKDTNYLMVTANITKGGRYVIYSDTVNGIWFRDSSFILTTGTQTFKLKGFGKPILPIDIPLTIFFDSSNCFVTIGLNGSIAVPPTTPPTNVFGTETDYFPTVMGNFWVYDYVDGTFTDSFSARVVNTATINNKTYSLIVTDANDTAYVRKDGNGKYFQYGNIGGRGNVQETQILDDKLNVGQQWNSPDFTDFDPTIGTFTFRVQYTIEQKNVSATINNLRIDSIIRVKEDVQIKIPTTTTYTSTLIYHNFYAKKIGLVTWDLSNFSPPYIQRIKRWQLN
jgi:hypothetical protein